MADSLVPDYGAPEYNPPTYDPTVTTPELPEIGTMPAKTDLSEGASENYTATDVAMNPVDQTVQSQMGGLLSDSSKYIQQARNNAMETANTRGLLNSSIAAGAEKAAIESALPIAQQDAKTYADQAQINAQAINDANAQGARLGTDVSMANADAANTLVNKSADLVSQQTLNEQQAAIKETQAQADFNRDLGLAATEVGYKTDIMELDANIKVALGEIQQEYAVALETLSQTYEIQKNLDTTMGTVYDGALRSISNILANDDMTTEQSTSSIKVLIDNLESSLKFLSGVSAEPNPVEYMPDEEPA